MVTAVITYFWLSEAVSFFDWIAIGCSFAGIILVNDPWQMNII